MSDEDGQYWLRVSDGQVVRANEARAADRLGPYASEAEARAGLAALHERERRKNAEDEAWNN